METKKLSTRGRPRKDYGELKSKIAKEAAENKGKFGRGRPKKQRNIDDSINTKISNHQKDISILEKKNKEIHENIKVSQIPDKTQKCENRNNMLERISRIILGFSILFFVFAVLYRTVAYNTKRSHDLKFSELTSDGYTKSDNIQMQIGYNNESGDFVEVEKVDIVKDEAGNNNNINNFKNINIQVDSDKISNSDIELIKLFYDKINNREFSELPDMADYYLKKDGTFKTYFGSNWLNKFLDKIVGNKVIVGGFSELPSNKPNVKNYKYNVRYKAITENQLTNEEWEIAIVEKNGEKLIGSIMCVTTGCSKMPFFQNK